MPTIRSLFLTVVKFSVEATVLTAIVLLVQAALRKQIAPRWRVTLWWLVFLRLILPFSPPSPTSIHNFLGMIRLNPGLMVGGQVVDDKGHPVSGAAVSLHKFWRKQRDQI